VATEGQGITDLISGIDKHREWFNSSDEGKRRKLRILEQNIVKLATETLLEKVMTGQAEHLSRLVQQCFERKNDPYTAVLELLKGM
jgi:putative protein kinase ArgK-like GTPase of G3E family